METSSKSAWVAGVTDKEVTQAQIQQQQRCITFATQTAQKIQSSQISRFSKLSPKALVPKAAAWYEACAQAMLVGNYSLIEQWIGQQANLAAEHGFQLNDLLEFLRICRSTAIEVEHWDEDIFSSVDEIINEGLQRIGGQGPWTIPQDLNYLGAQPGTGEAVKSAEEEPPAGNRRNTGRCRLELPVRVCAMDTVGYIDVVTRTRNVSSTGLNFLGRENYSSGLILQVTYPYWTDPGAINSPCPAKIVRLDHLQNGAQGVAIKFLAELNPGKSRRKY